MKRKRCVGGAVEIDQIPTIISSERCGVEESPRFTLPNHSELGSRQDRHAFERGMMFSPDGWLDRPHRPASRVAKFTQTVPWTWASQRLKRDPKPSFTMAVRSSRSARGRG